MALYLKQLFKTATLRLDQDEQEQSSRWRPLDVNSLIWNDDIGSMLTDMLTMAAYPVHSMVMHTEFFRKSVSPSLGFHPSATEAPHIWKSFMTDDHTPVELSWCWSAAKDTPKVRYSVEAISRLAAQGTDLVNAAANVRLLGDSLSIAPDMDLYLHRHFRNLLSFRHITQQTDATLQREVPQSQCFIAFDLLEKGMVVKQYYLPGQTAVREGSSNWNIIKDVTRKLSGPAAPLLASFDVLVSFIESLPAESQATVEILAIDCLEPIKSRLKVYIRTVDTTFHSVLNMLTLGGKSPKSGEEVNSLRDLWISVFGINPNSFDMYQPLPAKVHRTGGMLYYFELKANEVLPKSKVYLPVRHYAQNDDQIAKGLSNYLEHRRKKLSTGSYYHAVQKLWCVLSSTFESLTNRAIAATGTLLMG
ncbi:hypothetical protein H0G86_010338 [Trichoderma simmonsii]|uniref:Dimethylallyl tryptophan synthase n=1 Tax=Trichoderma simmonsii TaxID=1491479 RepID=A0A8G0LM36_9HYPO|nr:hypothetical protein H0G86_010338 [Trichoderma simmonsii]